LRQSHGHFFWHGILAVAQGFDFGADVGVGGEGFEKALPSSLNGCGGIAVGLVSQLVF
jgi:hypothetical protein